MIERDNQLADNGRLKRVYAFTLEGLQPQDIAAAPTASIVRRRLVTKTLLRDVLPEFAPYEKVEGLAVDKSGSLWVALDNDGGEFESRLVRYRRAIR